MELDQTKESGKPADISPAQNNPTPTEVADPRSFVLPNREVHSPLNAQRMSAGVLFTQENTATLPKAPPPLPINMNRDQNPDAVRPLETYQSDIEKYVRSQNISSIQVAAAEEDRRTKNAQSIEVSPKKEASFGVLRALAIMGGILFIIAATGAGVYSYIKLQPVLQPRDPVAPYISIDSTVDIPLAQNIARSEMMNSLVVAKTQVHISNGLLAQLRVWSGSSTQETTQQTAQNFFSALTPNIPPELLRTLQPEFLLGVHATESNQPFLLFSVDSYQGGYAGMLLWEKTMQQDLSPLFTYTSSERTANQTPPTIDPSRVLESPYIDTILDNHDVRAITNTKGEISFLWTFLDRTTVLITTNPATVHEVITRLKVAPHLIVPR